MNFTMTVGSKRNKAILFLKGSHKITISYINKVKTR